MLPLEKTISHEHEWLGNTTRLAAKMLTATRDTVPGLVWLGGFRSDMEGSKALKLFEFGQNTGAAALRFDYSGHGQSGGDFAEGTISRWVEESLSIIRAHTQGPQILVGSSMGAWIALRVAQRLQELGEQDRLAAMVLIAPAPDFTVELMEPEFTPDQKHELATNGFILEPSAYSDEPTKITSGLIEDGRNNLLLSGEIALGVPVRILQGMQDPDVPWQHAMRLVEQLSQDDVVVTMIKDGDHRLSREQDLEMLERALADVVAASQSASS